MKKLLLFLITTMLFIGCFGKKENISSQIIGNTYSLQGIFPESEIDINFEKDKISGTSGVNRYFANYTLEGNKILIQEAGSTKMMGPKNLMVQEQEYLRNLKESKEIEITKDGIILLTNLGVKLNFVKK